MKLVRKILVLLFAIAVILVGGAYFLPRNVIVERDILVDAPPDTVFPWVNSLKRGAEWSPWMRRDPEMQVAYGGQDEGVGATMEWRSEDPAVGIGRQEITRSVPYERVDTALDFGDMGTAEAWFSLVPEGTGTRVTWGLDADMGNSPVGRWMGLMMDRWVGADYEQGLENLKSLAEG